MSEYLKELEKRIRVLKNSYRGQNDFRTVKAEIQKRGGKWVAENGTTYQLVDNAIYAYTSEKGTSQLLIIAYDAPIPYIAELDYDLQFARPEDRRKLTEELNNEVRKHVATEPPSEIIVIVEKDWLSRISQKRWGTFNWQSHMQPTKMTLDARKRHNKIFDGNLIYPGDTFLVTH